MDSAAALDSLYRDTLDAIGAPIDTSYLDLLDNPSDTFNAPLDVRTSDVLSTLDGSVDALPVDSLNYDNSPFDASVIDTLNALNIPFDTSSLDFLDNVGGYVDQTNRNDLVQEPTSLPVPLSLDEGSRSTPQGADVPMSFDLPLASILDPSLSLYKQHLQNPQNQDIRASTINATTSTPVDGSNEQLHYSASSTIPLPLTSVTSDLSSGPCLPDLGLGINGHSGLMRGDNGDSMQQQMDPRYSGQIIAPSTSRRSDASSRKAPLFQFRKAKIDVAGVRGPKGLDIFFGIMDGEEATKKPFAETQKKVYDYVLNNSTLIGIFDFAWTPRGYLRCQGDCKLTATRWEIFPHGLCNQEFCDERRYVAHIKNVHLFDFPPGQAHLIPWIRRRTESAPQEQLPEI